MSEKLRILSSDGGVISAPLTGITYRDPKYHIRRMRSEITVMEYVCAGRGWIRLPEGIVSVRAGQVYYLCAGEDHDYGADPADPFEKVFINLSGPLAADLPLALGLPRCRIAPGEGMQDLFDRVRALVCRPPAQEDEEELIGLFVRFVLRLAKTGIKEEDDAARMKRYLDACTDRMVGIAELAARFYLSEDTCTARFRQAYGIPPYAYQLKRKIETACRLLRNTSMPVADIAAGIGYHDPQYFSGLFKSKIGCSPRQYRKQPDK